MTINYKADWEELRKEGEEWLEHAPKVYEVDGSNAEENLKQVWRDIVSVTYTNLG